MATPEVRLGAITFGTPDSDGDLFVVADIAGWTGIPVEQVTVDKPTADGAVFVYGRQQARALVVSGTGIAGSDGDVWRVRDKLEAAISAMVGSDGTLEVDEPEETVSLTVRAAGEQRVRPLGDIAIQFDISLLAADPAKNVVAS
jgi:hypothetical protein